MDKSPEAFRTISEVSEWLDTPAHVLRFWESRFTQVKPVKRAGGRRYYRPADMALLGGIKKLLHEDGLTIRGVQKILRSEGVRYVAALSPGLEDGGAPMAEDATPEKTEAADVLVLRGATLPEPEPEATETPAVEEEAATAAPEQVPVPAESEAPAARTAPKAPDRQPEFQFDIPDEPEAEPQDAQLSEPASAPPDDAPETVTPQEEEPQQPAPPAPVDLSGISDPPETDPAFAARHSPFPLRDPQSARQNLATSPGKAAMLYSRLVALRDQMAQRGR